MYNAIELLALYLIVEDNTSELRAIEVSVRKENVLAEVLNYLLESRRPGLDDLSRNDVGIDDRYSKSLQ